MATLTYYLIMLGMAGLFYLGTVIGHSMWLGVVFSLSGLLFAYFTLKPLESEE